MVIWPPGNEAGTGSSFVTMRNWIRWTDPTRIIQHRGDTRPSPATPTGVPTSSAAEPRPEPARRSRRGLLRGHFGSVSPETLTIDVNAHIIVTPAMLASGARHAGVPRPSCLPPPNPVPPGKSRRRGPGADPLAGPPPTPAGPAPVPPHARGLNPGGGRAPRGRPGVPR
ncbi:glycoside hydrolase family 2 TIM barrel-domain containing protein [Micromonospora rosaria]|uniref:glycoside hydrolase family 2 TIM barrel-domain containing protein n=1 Tax=Micromonospora rosaria TaxID=47874 RepID=UPI0012F75814|nr:glycoside hydrolase family 2 TIM barrel-domain containing protein [Micromonospora rosaria]